MLGAYGCMHNANLVNSTHSYFVASSFKYEGKNSCHDLIANTRIWTCFSHIVCNINNNNFGLNSPLSVRACQLTDNLIPIFSRQR